MAPPNPRVKAAFMAMKAIGISEKKTKPVLKKLLKLFDKNWDLIEEENYRVLADAIFDDEDNEVAEKEKIPETTNDQRDAPEEEETHLNEEPERPLKRLRLKHQGTSSNVQPSTNTALKVPKPEPCELENVPGQRGQPLTSPSVARNKGKQPMIPPNSSGPVKEKSKRGALESAPQGLHIREPNVVPSSKNKQPSNASLIRVKDEPFTGDMLSMEPLAVVLPERSNSEARPNITTPSDKQTEHPLASKSVNGVDKVAEALTSPIEIATSSQGQVEICLSCNPGLNSTNIHAPDLQAVFKKVEDNCIKTYKVMDPKFTLNGVMKDLCECVVELQTNEDSRVLNNKETCLNGSLDVVPSDNLATPTENDNHFAENDVSDVNEKLDHDSIQCVYDPSDITRGQEDTKVSLEKSNSERLPNFLYIAQNVVWHDADVKFSLAQIGDRDCCVTCNGDCFALSPSCNCVHKNGGESSYKSDGLLREEFLEEYISIVRNPKDYLIYCKDCPLERLKNEDMVDPCKGHLKRKFIKECWIKCSCISNCGNRVVQRGLKCNLQVFWTPEGKGWGLRTLEEIPKGAFVCEYVGEILTITELQKRITRRNNDKHSYSVVLDTDWGSKTLKEKEVLCLDSTFYGNVARFINHRCTDANLIEIPVEVETPKHHYYHVALFATRKIEAFEELTWDYGVDFDDSEHHIKAFRCLCGSQFCRNMKRSSRSRSSLTLR